MKVQKSITLATICVVTAFGMSMTTTPEAVAGEEDTKFICASGFDKSTNQHFPTTYAWRKRGKVAVVRWKYNWVKNSELTPQQRCQQVTSRLQTAYNNNSINYLTNGTENGQRVICTAREKGGACDTTILTLRPEDDSLEILAKLNQNLGGGGGGEPIEHSGKRKRQVYYPIDIDKFLKTAPVESE